MIRTIILGNLALLSFSLALPIQAATYEDANGISLLIGSCTLVSTRPEADATHVYTLNPDHTIQLDQAYLDFLSRNARCDELQFHVDHATTLERLRLWLGDTALKVFIDGAPTRLEGQTVSTSRHEWFFLTNGTLHRIPDWLTALSWGLLMTDRQSIPMHLTTAFYDTMAVGEPLNFSRGPYATTIHRIWKEGLTNYSSLPKRLAAEISAFTENSSYENAFLTNVYVPRSAHDAYANLLDWSWMEANPVNFTIAFIGDQGYGEDSKAVLRLIKTEGADVVLHQGDFDYRDCPDCWDQQINDVLGPEFPYFSVIGNHDEFAWNGYQEKIRERMRKIPGGSCTGDLGVKSVCTYHGFLFVFSGVGTKGTDHPAYMKEQLSNSSATWKICSWHKNQHLMQTGGKGDEVGWEAYEVCREAGAIIATAHEHSYSRTHLMADFEKQLIASTSSTLTLEPGKTFVFVSGLGGSSVRGQNDDLADKPWWASVYNQDLNANFGALFCTFNKDGTKNHASCYFKDINGRIPDRFGLVSKL